ncbi:MFS transporter [Algiphilus sp.]|uniref:MFS transporter n=1 Tax=Algiphilus sp. TaxID=1872431 RepID=UPI003B523E0B
MTPTEWRATLGLSAVYALRMFGLFMVLPAFAPYAAELDGGQFALLVGLALGIYGLTQAVCQIPFGMASDRFGRKPVIVVGMLIFAAGSVVAGMADSMAGLIAGRALQGAGAISAAAAALVADITRPQVRTMAMAILGAGMGASFILALVAGPPVSGLIGVDGILVAAGWFSLAAIAVVIWVVPAAPKGPAASAALGPVLRDRTLWQLNAGIFLLHALLTSSFVLFPRLFEAAFDLAVAGQWRIYLPVMLGSLAIVLPLIRWADTRDRVREVFVAAVFALLAACLLLAGGSHSLTLLIVGVLLYFAGFNYLEGALPSLVSRLAPEASRGAALGLYATAQFLGAFCGGLLGGLAAGAEAHGAGFWLLAVIPLLWCTFAYRLRTERPAATV